MLYIQRTRKLLCNEFIEVLDVKIIKENHLNTFSSTNDIFLSNHGFEKPKTVPMSFLVNQWCMPPFVLS